MIPFIFVFASLVFFNVVIVIKLDDIKTKIKNLDSLCSTFRHKDMITIIPNKPCNHSWKLSVNHGEKNINIIQMIAKCQYCQESSSMDFMLSYDDEDINELHAYRAANFFRFSGIKFDDVYRMIRVEVSNICEWHRKNDIVETKS